MRGLHSRRSSQQLQLDVLQSPVHGLQQQQQQQLPTSLLSEETMAETLYSCLYAGRLEAHSGKVW